MENSYSGLKDKLYNMKINLKENTKYNGNKSGDVVKKTWTNATVEEVIRKILDSNNPLKRRLGDNKD